MGHTLTATECKFYSLVCGCTLLDATNAIKMQMSRTSSRNVTFMVMVSFPIYVWKPNKTKLKLNYSLVTITFFRRLTVPLERSSFTSAQSVRSLCHCVCSNHYKRTCRRDMQNFYRRKHTEGDIDKQN